MAKLFRNLRPISMVSVFWLSLAGMGNNTLAEPQLDSDQTALKVDFTSEVLTSVPLYGGYGSIVKWFSQVQGLDLSFSNLITIDGFYATDPITAGAAIDLPVAVIQQLTLVTSGTMAKQQNSAGTLIKADLLTTHEPMQWGFDLVTRPAFLQHHQQLPQTNQASYNQLAFHASGELIPQKLWYLAATQFDYAWADGQTNFTGNRHDDRNMWRLTYLGRLVWRPDDSHRLRLLLSGSPSFHQNVLQEYRVEPASQVQLDHHTHLFGIGWQADLNQRISTQVDLTYHLRQHSREPNSQCSSVTNANCRISYDAQTEIFASDNSISQTDKTHRIGLQTHLDWKSAGTVGFRLWQAGFNLDYTTLAQAKWIPGGAYLINRQGLPYQITLQEEIDGKIQSASGAAQHLSAGLYLQTSWQPHPEITIHPGLRLDADWLLSGDEQQMRRFHFLPRINLRWQPAQTSSTIWAGYHRLRLSPSLLYLQDQIYVPLATNTYEYDPTTDDYSRFYRRRAAIDPRYNNLPNPEVDQIHVQYQQEIWKQMHASVSALWHHQAWPGTNQSIDALHFQITIRGTLAPAWFGWAAYGYNVQINPDSQNQSDAENTPQTIYAPRTRHPNPRNSHQVALWIQQQLGGGVSWSIGLNWLRADFSRCEDKSEQTLDHTWPITREASCSHNQHVHLDTRLAWDLQPLTGSSISILLDLLSNFQQQAMVLDILNSPPDSDTKNIEWSQQLWTNLSLRWRY